MHIPIIWLNRMKLAEDNKGIGTVEMILILVVIFTIYKGCK